MKELALSTTLMLSFFSIYVVFVIVMLTMMALEFNFPLTEDKGMRDLITGQSMGDRTYYLYITQK